MGGGGRIEAPSTILFPLIRVRLQIIFMTMSLFSFFSFIFAYVEKTHRLETTKVSAKYLENRCLAYENTCVSYLTYLFQGLIIVF
jgi:hypothetical protein